MTNKINKSYIGLIVWFLGSLFFLTEYGVRVSTGVLSSHLLNDFNVDITKIGMLSAYFYYAYIGMQIPVGILVDRFGSKFILTSATVIFGLMNLLFSQMHIIETGYLARFFMGFFGAFAFVGTLKLITLYFPASRFALLSGLTQGMGMVGAVIGAAPMAYIFAEFGWRSAFFIFGFWFIVLGFLIFFLVKEEKVSENAIKSSILDDIKLVLKNPQAWLNCLFIGLLYAPTEIFGEQWGALFFQYNNNLDNTKAAFINSCAFIGMAIGCPLLGMISDKLKSRVLVMRYSAFLCLISISFVIYASNLGITLNSITLEVLLFIYGIFAAGIIPSYALAAEQQTPRVAGIALGISNMATVIIGAIFIPVLGFMIDKLSIIHHTFDKVGLAKYTLNDFKIAFLLLPLSLIICLFISFIIKDSKIN